MKIPHPAGRLGLEPLEARDTPAVFRAFGAVAGGRPLVEVFRPDGTSLVRFQAFEDSFRGGVRATIAELDGNSNTLEVVTAAGPGGAPVVRVYTVDIQTGAVSAPVSFFAFNEDFRGGIRVAAGRFTGAVGPDQIVVSADEGGGPRVRVLDYNNGNPVPIATPLGDFFAFEFSQRGGSRVAAGELDGNVLDGDELMVGAGTNGGPRVRVIRSDGAILADYFAFDPNFRGGVQVQVDESTVVSRPVVDAFADDPSQRNAALNTAALLGFTTQNRTAVTETGSGIPTTPTGIAGTTATTSDVSSRVSVGNTPGSSALGVTTSTTGVVPVGVNPNGLTGTVNGFVMGVNTPTVTGFVTPTTVGVFTPTTAVGFSTPTVSPVTTGQVSAAAAGTVVNANTAAGVSTTGSVLTNSAAAGTIAPTATTNSNTTSNPATTTTGFGPAGDPGPANPFPLLAVFPVFVPGVFYQIPI